MATTRSSLKEKVYSTLKEQICNRVYAPGDRINIDSIAKEYGVSNSPIREAINMLVTDGLLQNVQNSSPRVTCLTDREKHEMYCAISALLVGCYTIHIAGQKEEELAKVMEERLERQKKMIEVGDWEKELVAAMEFDQSIIDVAKNPRLRGIYDYLVGLFFLTVRTYSMEHSRDASVSEHEGILEAVYAKDAALLQARLKGHYYQIVKPD